MLKMADIHRIQQIFLFQINTFYIIFYLIFSSDFKFDVKKKFRVDA